MSNTWLKELLVSVNTVGVRHTLDVEDVEDTHIMFLKNTARLVDTVDLGELEDIVGRTRKLIELELFNKD